MIRIGTALLFLACATSAHAQIFAAYSCADGTNISAAFFKGDKRMHMQLDGKAVVLPQRLSASGARYAKSGLSFWVKGREATLKRPKQRSTLCRTQ